MENAERATRAAEAVAIYTRSHYNGASAQDGTDFALVARDLISDLCHALDARALDSGQAVAEAYSRYAEEDDAELMQEINGAGHRARSVRYTLDRLAGQLDAYDKMDGVATDGSLPYDIRATADRQLMERAHDAVSTADDLMRALRPLVTAKGDRSDEHAPGQAQHLTER
ncbi:hypothetical protein [Nonomuraea helvata]|uniref:Uncharacterized protein n=1 Tax=Nonomuraea helvata TaxID=37484 RepID=A0ABV5S5Y2_9ACTN